MTQETGKGRTREDRFEGYVGHVIDALGHADRAAPFRAYCSGLLLPTERKSVEPMAAVVDPDHVQARHQSMHHFVSTAPWSDEEVLRAAYEWGVEPLLKHGGIDAWVVDDTGMPKKGEKSVGVARQYCGATGKQDNCQDAVSLSAVNEAGSLPVAYRLYLPEEWAKDRARRNKAGVPKEIEFQTKWQIALDHIDRVLAQAVPQAPVVADAGYGNAVDFRDGVTERHLPYVLAIQSNTTAWPPGQEPLPPAEYRGTGRIPRWRRRDREHRPVSVLQLAQSLAPSSFRSVSWREGTSGKMRSRFAAVRVRPAHKDDRRTEPRPVEWLLVEWPCGEKEPTKYWFSTLPSRTPLRHLVRIAKIRWRVDRDYQELKDELGLDHYEGRNWRGFHHHASLCIAAYAFLMAERLRFSPRRPRGVRSFLQMPPVPEDYRPRGGTARAAASADVDRDPASPTRHRAGPRTAALPVLRPSTAPNATDAPHDAPAVEVGGSESS
jgi:SRSO17 transposase